MILNDIFIRDLCVSDPPLVDPYDPSLVNPASLDIRVGETAKQMLWDSQEPDMMLWVNLDLSNTSKNDPLIIPPRTRLLVASLETINMPTDLCAQFRLKSSRGREFWEHMEAGFCDPGWHGSKLTMELINHSLAPLPLYKGMRIGQLIFSEVYPPQKSYAEVGRYNNDKQVQESKG